jgi:multidrug resistance efflux pump
MSITDVFRINQIKAELAQSNQQSVDLRQLLADTQRLELHEIPAQIAKLTAERDQAQAALEDLRFRWSRAGALESTRWK